MPSRDQVRTKVISATQSRRGASAAKRRSTRSVGRAPAGSVLVVNTFFDWCIPARPRLRVIRPDPGRSPNPVAASRDASSWGAESACARPIDAHGRQVRRLSIPGPARCRGYRRHVAEDDETKRPIRWSAVVGCGLAGLTLIALAWLLSMTGRTGFLSSVLVEVGVAVFLAGLLFLLERQFVGVVSRAATTAAKTAAAEAATAAVRDVTNRIERLERLEENVADGLQKRAERDDTVVATAVTAVSFQNIAVPMNLAKERGAISGSVAVLAGTTPAAAMLTFGLGYYKDNVEQTRPDGVTVNYFGDRNPSGGPGIPVCEVALTEDTSFSEMVLELVDTMQKAGFGREAKTIEAQPLFTNLIEGLGDAVKGRRADDDAWRSAGTLLEILGPDWVISTDGVEERTHGVVLAAKDFPEALREMGPPEFHPDRPDWADASWWAFVVRRGMRHRSQFSGRVMPWM